MGEIQLGPVNSLIPLTPGFGFEQALTMVNRQDHRTKEGTLYTYIETGTFRRFALPWSFVNSSERSLVNSWWVSGQDLRFILDSSFSSSFYTVRIMEVEEPFQAFVKPYGIGDSASQPLWDGEIVLETT